MKNRLIILVLISIAGMWPTGIFAQDLLDSMQYNYAKFEKEVLNYSQSLKQSKEKQVAMQKAMKLAKTSFLPAIDAMGNYQYRTNDMELPFGSTAIPIKHDAYSAGVSVMQPIYAGGSVIHNYKAKEVQNAIAEKGVELTRDNIIYAAENSYWGAAAQKELYDVMTRYTDIVGRLLKVLEDRYADGMISKTDLIQMQVRKQEAEMQCLNTLEQYKIALQNMNVMMGKNPTDSLVIIEKMFKVNGLLKSKTLDEVLNNSPEYAISKFNLDFQQHQMKLASVKFNPTLSFGYQGVWGTQMLNIDGDTKFNSTLMFSLKIPVFSWGARYKSRSSQRALLNEKRYELQQKQDQISKELASSLTKLEEAQTRVSLALKNCVLADENLDLNTFSYTEGKLSILDVLSAQLTWIQSYTTLIQAYYQRKMAGAEYRKVSGAEYLQE